TTTQRRTVKKTVARSLDLIRPTRAKVGTGYFSTICQAYQGFREKIIFIQSSKWRSDLTLH
ncbi:TPA: hypothetical protein ACGO30_001264, partial [Streptococcus suis]